MTARMIPSARTSRHFTTILLALSITLLTVMIAARPASAAPSASSFASRLVQLVNNARSQHGLAPLSVTAGTSSVAASWTSYLAQQGTLSHNPQLVHDVAHHGSPQWQVIGENVGSGPVNDPDALFRAYMNSPDHRDKILNGRYRYLGIAVRFASNQAWNTMDFVDQYGASASTPKAHKQKTPAKKAHSVRQSAPAREATAPVQRPTRHAAPVAPTSREQHADHRTAATSRSHHKPVPHARPHAASAPTSNRAQVTVDHIGAGADAGVIAAGVTGPTPHGAVSSSVVVAAVVLLSALAYAHVVIRRRSAVRAH